MSKTQRLICIGVSCWLFSGWTFNSLQADDSKKADSPAPVKAPGDDQAAAGGAAQSGGQAAPAGSPPPYASILKDTKTLPSGLLTLYQKGNNLIAELSPGDYGAEYIV